MLGGVASFQRPDADLQYLSLVAAAALDKEPQSLLLLVSPTDTDNAKKGQTGVFLLAGPPDGHALNTTGVDMHAALSLLATVCCASAVLQKFQASASCAISCMLWYKVEQI